MDDGFGRASLDIPLAPIPSSKNRTPNLGIGTAFSEAGSGQTPSSALRHRESLEATRSALAGYLIQPRNWAREVQGKYDTSVLWHRISSCTIKSNCESVLERHRCSDQPRAGPLPGLGHDRTADDSLLGARPKGRTRSPRARCSQCLRSDVLKA